MPPLVATFFMVAVQVRMPLSGCHRRGAGPPCRPGCGRRCRSGTGQGRADVGGQPAAGLQGRFQQDREGHARLTLGAEEPGVGGQVVLGLGHGPGGHLPRLAAQGGDPVHELERRAGQAGDLAAAVEDPVAARRSPRTDCRCCRPGSAPWCRWPAFGPSCDLCCASRLPERLQLSLWSCRSGGPTWW